MSALEARGPLPATRRAQLLDALHRDGSVRVSELSELLGVTAVTVRRDITQLAQEGLARRVHGGATLPHADDDRAEPLVVAPSAPGAAAPAGAVGMLVPSIDYYWPGVAQGAEEEAATHGLRLVLRGSSYETDDDRPHLVRLVEHVGVRGLVVAPDMSARTIDWLASAEVPTVLVERTATVGPHRAVMESVVSDHALGAGMAVRHLASLGHRRIGLVLTGQSPTGPHVRRGWIEACEEGGLRPGDAVDIAVPDRRTPQWEAAVPAVLERCLSTGTTALLVHADTDAMALVQCAEALGISVPRDLSVVAYDDEVARLFSPPLTAVRPPRQSIGRAAVALLTARLADPRRPAHRIVISPSLHVRGSTGPAPANR